MLVTSELRRQTQTSFVWYERREGESLTEPLAIMWPRMAGQRAVLISEFL